MRPLVLLLILVLNSLASHAQSQPAGPRLLAEERHTLTSQINGKTYVLQVSLPKGYDRQAAATYPILYLLDGHLYFPVAATTRALLDLAGGLEPVVIVGVSDAVDTHEFSWNASRWLDYSPSHDPERDARNTQRYGMPADLPLRSGGAPAFLQVLRTEIIPFVEARYRVGADRGLGGHSMGGVFTTYALAVAPDLFRRFAILSPTTWKDDELLQMIRNRPPALQPQTRVLITWAEQENPAAIRFAQELAAGLRPRLAEPGQLTQHGFEGEGHHSVVPAALSRLLTVLYAAPRADAAR
jgi:predicted alpha/beta superfamily hydrolase